MSRIFILLTAFFLIAMSGASPKPEVKEKGSKAKFSLYDLGFEKLDSDEKFTRKGAIIQLGDKSTVVMFHFKGCHACAMQSELFGCLEKNKINIVNIGFNSGDSFGSAAEKKAYKQSMAKWVAKKFKHKGINWFANQLVVSALKINATPTIYLLNSKGEMINKGPLVGLKTCDFLKKSLK